jgi:cytochrome oxidase Cu insertion factor (SCO1/SenC/PrrC family)
MDAGAGLQAKGRRREWGTGGQVALILVVAALTGLGVGVGAHLVAASGSTTTSAPVSASGGLRGPATWPAGARPAPMIRGLIDQSGGRFSLASLRGRTVVMEFFDSHCHQECPLAGRALAAAERALPRAQRPVLVVVSVNPLDTPASTRAAVREWGLAGLAPWHWLRGTHARLAPAWAAYHVVVVPQTGDISHTEALYLIDRHGDERSGYLYPYNPSFVAHDLRMLANGRARHGAGRA